MKHYFCVWECDGVRLSAMQWILMKVSILLRKLQITHWKYSKLSMPPDSPQAMPTLPHYLFLGMPRRILRQLDIAGSQKCYRQGEDYTGKIQTNRYPYKRN